MLIEYITETEKNMNFVACIIRYTDEITRKTILIHNFLDKLSTTEGKKKLFECKTIIGTTLNIEVHEKDKKNAIALIQDIIRNYKGLIAYDSFVNQSYLIPAIIKRTNMIDLTSWGYIFAQNTYLHNEYRLYKSTTGLMKYEPVNEILKTIESNELIFKPK